NRPSGGIDPQGALRDGEANRTQSLATQHVSAKFRQPVCLKRGRFFPSAIYVQTSGFHLTGFLQCKSDRIVERQYRSGLRSGDGGERQEAGNHDTLVHPSSFLAASVNSVTFAF